ncbi:YcxB-like protein [Seinonella peptonophila]|uniref:YcxB-like protein n=1 Tax=Seinonella peptonophila TaxID=112248 RepID=A0A1M5AR68_9BACL|nr:YcxB family protein [Seinonella peptonophila]SHF32730.1 YcxB-like protein [Seinonella peptonophila]
MNISFNMDIKDNAIFQRFMLKKPRVMFFHSYFPYFALFMYIGFYTFQEEPLLLSIWEEISIDIIMLLIALLFSIITSHLNIHYWIKKNPNKLELGPHTVKIDGEGLTYQSPVSNGFTQWSGLERIERNKQYFYVFINPIMAHIIPIRAFSSSNEAEQFYLQIQTYLKRK